MLDVQILGVLHALHVIRLRLLTNLIVLLLPAVGCALLLPAVGFALLLLFHHVSSAHSDSVL